MMLQRLFRSTFLAVAGFVATQGYAQTPVSYNAGDLLIGFHATSGTGVTQCYVVNAGPARMLADATSAVTLPNTVKADLDATYGTTWKTRNDFYWGAVAAGDGLGANGDPNFTLYATKPQITVGTLNNSSARWPRKSESTQSIPANKIATAGGGYKFDVGGATALSTANNPKGVLQLNSDGDSWASYQSPDGVADNAHAGSSRICFAYWSYSESGKELGVQDTFANGTAGAVLELYRLAPSGGSVPANTPGDFLGTLTIDDSGTITFTPDTTTARITLDQATYSLSEADANGKVTVSLTRSRNTASTVTATLNTTAGSAIANTDFTPLTNFQVQFDPGQTTKTVDIPIFNRSGVQADKSFTVSITSVGAGASVGFTGVSTVTLTESEAGVQFSDSAYSFQEDAGNAAIIVNRVGNPTLAFTVDFSTANGGGANAAAQQPGDYAQTSTQLSFAANDVNPKTVNVGLVNRIGLQGSRDFAVSLTNASGATLGSPASAVVTITDKPGNPGEIAFASATQTAEPLNVQKLPTLITVPLTRTNGTTGTVTADVAVTGGTLGNGTNFNNFSTTTVNFADGVSTGSVDIQLKSPATAGTIILTVSNPTGGASVVAPTSTTITVNAADKVLPKLVLTAPKAGTLAPGLTAFDVTGTATDDRAVDHVEITINGVTTNVVPTVGTGSFSKTSVAAENGSNTVTVVAVDTNGNRSKPVTKVVNFINNRPALAGVYNGLLVPVGALSNDKSGLVNLTVKPTGTFTGKVSIGAFIVPISGIVGNDNKLHFKPTLDTTLTLTGKAKVPMQFGLLKLNVIADQVTGALTEADGSTLKANIDGDRAIFDGKTPATTVPAGLLNAANGKKGFYTVRFPAKAQTPAVPLSDYPQGDGFASISLTPKGAVTLKFTLADGTVGSASVGLSKNFEAPLYAKLYSKKGSIAGLAVFDVSAATHADTDVLGTDFLWFRPTQSTQKYYPGGWPNGIKVDLKGAKYAVPAVGTSVLPGLGAIGSGTGNATLTLGKGKLTTDPLVNALDVAPNNKTTPIVVGGKAFTVKIVATTGAISGNFTHTDGSKPTYKGVILQKGANSGGYGYFQSVVAKGSVVTGESGSVALEAK